MLHYCIYVTYHGTGKFYVGKGVTANVESGKYQGSGRVLKNAWLKYPREEWITDIVSLHETEAEAYAQEAFWVDEDLLKDPLNLNIQLGGKGGGNPTLWAKTWRNTEFQRAMARRAWDSPVVQQFQREKTASRWKSGPLRQQQRAGAKRKWEDQEYRTKMSQERSARIKGIRWLCKDGIARQIPVDQVETFIANGWKRGMK